MTRWSEEDFLEKLMSYTNAAGRTDRCPETESLAAFFEGTLRREGSEAIRVHIQHCRACAEVGARLQEFDRTEPAISQKEWHNVELRLDLWMEPLLKGGTPAADPYVRHPEAGLWQKLRTWVWVPEFRYAFSAAVAVVIVASASVLVIRQTSRTPQSATAPTQSGEPAPAPKPSPATAAEVKPPSTLAGAAVELEAAAGTGASSAGAKLGATPTEGTSAGTSVAPAGKTWTVPATSFSSIDGAKPIAPAQQQQQPVSRSAKAVFSMAAPARTEVRIAAATGMLLRVDSVVKEGGGATTFRAHLVQSVVQDGVQVLPAGAILNGTLVRQSTGEGFRVSEIELPGAGRFVVKPLEFFPNARLDSPVAGMTAGATIELRFVSSVVFKRQS
jgi:hypothetical protein